MVIVTSRCLLLQAITWMLILNRKWVSIEVCSITGELLFVVNSCECEIMLITPASILEFEALIHLLVG